MMRAYYDADGSPALAARPVCGSHDADSDLAQMQLVRRKTAVLVAIICTTIAAGGCVYRANISQGNIVEEEDLDQVEIGMTRNQVRFLLGTPMIDDPFHQDRWDYVYYVKIGRKDASSKRWVSILFDGETVTEIRRNQELDTRL